MTHLNSSEFGLGAVAALHIPKKKKNQYFIKRKLIKYETFVPLKVRVQSH